MLGLLAISTPLAARPFGIFSPDHPQSWYVTSNFQKEDQALRWDPKSEMLCADISYTLNGESPDYRYPEMLHSFTLHFPSVRLDHSTGTLFCIDGRSRIAIGHLKSWVFGHHIELNRNVELQADRVNGRMVAVLLVR